MLETNIVVIHDQIPHISLPNPSFLRSRPHPNESSTRSMSRRRHDDACAGRFVSSDESIASLLNTECDFFFFLKEEKAAVFFPFLSLISLSSFFPQKRLAVVFFCEIKERRRPFIKTRFDERTQNHFDGNTSSSLRVFVSRFFHERLCF